MILRDAGRRFAIALFVLTGLASLALAGNNPGAKAAVHVLPHDGTRTCSRSFPEIGSCSDILTTYAGCGDVDIFPVFYEISEYLGVEYGLTWPGSGSCAFTSCSDLKIGDISWSGDGISQTWFQCHEAGVLIPGFGWIYADVAEQISLVPHPQGGAISILDCAEALDRPSPVFSAGVCGEQGYDPCGILHRPLFLDKDDLMEGGCIGVGETMAYWIHYGNPNSLADVHGVVIIDHLPAEVDYVSSWPAGAYYDSGLHTVTRDVGTLRAGTYYYLEVRASVRPETQPGAMITNLCEITCDELGATSSEISTQVCTGFEPLNLSKTDGLGSTCAERGQEFTYTISYGNLDNAEDVHNVMLVDDLPAKVLYVASPGGTYDSGGHQVSWDLGTIAAGSRDSVFVTVQVKDAATEGSTMENRCEITGDETGPSSASAQTTICSHPQEPFFVRVALHVVPHDEQRTCSGNMPQITACEQVVSRSDAWDVDVFPVFYGLEEYLGAEYGLHWTPGTAALFSSCSDLTIGTISYPGAGISQTWTSCQPGPVCIPGWIWLSVDAPTRICVVGHHISDQMNILNCDEQLGDLVYDACAGVFGGEGDDPCDRPVNTRPTTWGGIKSMFR